MVRTKWCALIALFAGLADTAAVLAHGDEQRDGKPKAKTMAVEPEQKAWGIAGDSKKVTRTIKMDMSDEMRYHPSLITVKQGETVRFELRNRGRTLHEMVIGTMPELEAHAALMKKFPDMEHDEPYMAHVAPGKSQNIVWRFNRTGEFNYACLIPGHFESGMIGKVVVK
jgi:uncharacterized cupredoxin-like copper-binding protein